MKYLRILIGVCTWAAAALLLWWCVDGRDEQASQVNRRAARQLVDLAVGPRHTYAIELQPAAPLAVGDPVFAAQSRGGFRQVGEVRAVYGPNDGEATRYARTERAEVLLYASAPPIAGDARLVYHTTPHSMEWVLQTLLPPEKQERVAAELSDAFHEHHEEILAQLMPVVEASFREGLVVVEQDLAASLASRRGEIEALGGKYQREVVEKELVPLVRNEIWPIVREQATPTAEEIGQKLWQRASVWRFGWRYVYDKSFAPEKSLFKKEWERYLKEDAAPVFRRHTDDIVAAQQRILAEVAKNEKVQEAIRRNLSRVLDDPELRQLVWEIIEEVIVNNPRLHEVLQRHWTGPEAQAAFRLAGERLQPTVQRIGEMVIGSQAEGMTPEFARVLRAQVLYKDRRWLVLETGGGGRAADDAMSAPPRTLPVVRGEVGAPSPFVDAVD
ncbi:MAG: hypothetical protein RIC55_33235 [Pirellulaceae bacterium]